MTKLASTARARWSAVAAVIVLLLAATLAPFHPGPQSPVPWSCVACMPEGGADFVANIAAFLPLGIVLSYAGLSGRRAVAIGTGLSAAIELLQATGIAGRTAVLGDVLANAAGAALGVAVVAGAVASRYATPRLARCLAAATGATWVALMTGSAWLLDREPTSGPRPPRTNAAPYVSGFGWYGGQVAGFTLDGWTTGRSGTGPLIVAAPLGRTARVAARLVGGDARTTFVPAAAVLDAAGDPVLLLGQRGRAAELHLRARAHHWRLRDPVLVVPRALAPLRHGNPATQATLAATLGPGWATLRVQAEGPTGAAMGAGLLHAGPAMGWTLVTPLPPLGGAAAVLMNAAWVAVLLVPAGYWLQQSGGDGWRGTAGRVGAGAALTALGLVVAPRVVAAPRGTPADWLVAAGALAVGWWAAARLSRSPPPASLQA